MVPMLDPDLVPVEEEEEAQNVLITMEVQEEAEVVVELEEAVARSISNLRQLLLARSPQQLVLRGVEVEEDQLGTGRTDQVLPVSVVEVVVPDRSVGSAVTIAPETVPRLLLSPIRR